jgi:CheY-like chemotaxis protein
MTIAEPATLPLILLAEDALLDIFFLRRALVKAALANPIVVVRDGQEAIDYLEGQGRYADRKTYPLPGLLLLDLEMPRVDGFGVLAWLQTQAAFERLPKVVLSDSRREENALKARELGADEYRVKPTAPDDLTKIVDELHARWLAPAPAAVFEPSSAQAGHRPESLYDDTSHSLAGGTRAL